MSIPRNLSPSHIQHRNERADNSTRPSVIKRVESLAVLPQSLQLRELLLQPPKYPATLLQPTSSQMQPAPGQQSAIPSCSKPELYGCIDFATREQIKNFATDLLEKKVDIPTIYEEVLKNYNVECGPTNIVKWGIETGTLLNSEQKKQENKKLQAEALRLSVEEQVPVTQIAHKYQKNPKVIYRWLREARKHATTSNSQQLPARLFENESYVGRVKIKAFAVGLMERKVNPSEILTRIKNKFEVECQPSTINKWQTKAGLVFDTDTSSKSSDSDEQLEKTDKL